MTSLAERTRLSRALNELDMRIHSKLSFDEVMQSTLEGFIATLRAEAGDIKLFDGERWSVSYVVGFAPEVVGQELRIPEAPVAAKAATLAEPVTIEDYLAEPPSFYVGFPATHHLRACLAVPLIIGQQVTGCLFAWMRSGPRAFTEAEVDFGRRVATSVALAIENTRLFAAEQEARKRAEAAEQNLARELALTRVLLRASDELLSAADPDELLRCLANVVLDATGLTRVFINLVDLRERVLIPKVATGGLVAPTGERIPFERLSETARRAIVAGKPTVLDYECPDTPQADRAIARANNARVVLFVPLVHRGVVIGHISIDEPGERYEFSDEQIQIVGSIAAEAAIALRSTQQATEQAVELVERQLRSMAYGLHDGPAQTLSAASAMLEATQRTDDLDVIRAQTAAACGLVEHASFEMREIMRDLRPVELEGERFTAQIRQYAEAVEERWGTPVRVDVVGIEAPIAHHVQVSLFRVVQEALSNARKHANARSIAIGVRFHPSYVECTVRDDGEGFDTAHIKDVDATEHWGLASMRDRMLMIGADFVIESTLGEGTVVRVRAPLEPHRSSGR